MGFSHSTTGEKTNPRERSKQGMFSTAGSIVLVGTYDDRSKSELAAWGTIQCCSLMTSMVNVNLGMDFVVSKEYWFIIQMFLMYALLFVT